MYSEADLLPLSGLQHLVFCERQCALIHLERVWRDNVLTVQGKLLHERTDTGTDETRGDRRVVRSVPIRSLRLGIAGKADVVEFRRLAEGEERPGAAIEGLEGCWRPFPVEYKRGAPKRDLCDRVQLCAQALCLEEMLELRVPEGALFYGKPRRRLDVCFDDDLRLATERAAGRFHELMNSGVTPLVLRQPKCRSCSLLPICLPPPRPRSVARYLRSALRDDARASRGG